MRNFAAAVAAVAGAALLGVSALAFVAAAQPGTTHSISRLLSAAAGSPSPSQAPEQHNGSGQEPDGTVRSGAAENEQGEDEACTGNDADIAEDQQRDEAENQQGADRACAENDANEAEHQQGTDEHGPANGSDVTEQH